MKTSSFSVHRSISRRLSLWLIITLLRVAGLSLSVNFIISTHKASAMLERKVDEYILALIDTVKRPLETYNEEVIDE